MTFNGRPASRDFFSPGAILFSSFIHLRLMLRRGSKLIRRLISSPAAAPNLPFSGFPWAEPPVTRTFPTGFDSKPFRAAISSGRRHRRRRVLPEPDLRQEPSALSPPEVESICSLLSDPSSRARPVENLLKDHGDRLSSDLVLCILINYKKLGRGRTLEFFSWAGNRLSYRFDDAVVEYMADFLGRRKLFDDLKCLLRTIRSSNDRVSPRAISICIRFLGRQGRVAEAMSLLETMESELNCPPDNIVFNNVLYMLCRLTHTENSIDVALTFFRRIGCPDEYSYSNILLGLCKSGRTDNALKMFDEMLKTNILPTRTAANVLVGELCRRSFRKTEIVPVKSVRQPFDVVVPALSIDQGVNSVLGVFWSLRKQGLLPSPFVVNHLISELHRLWMIDEAADVLKAAACKNPSSFQESYVSTIRALCLVRRLDDAVDLLQRMILQGLKPKASVYTSIISAFCKRGNLDGAQRHFELMNKMRCEPEAGGYTALVRAYCGIRSWEVAYELLMEMLGLGMAPPPATQKLVADQLKQNGRSDFSGKLQARLEALLLERRCKAGDLEAAYEKLTEMNREGIQPPPYMLRRLELAFRGSKWWKPVRELLHHMDRVSSRGSNVNISP